MNRFIPKLLLAPAVSSLFLWMVVPLGMTIYFSLIRYNLLQPERTGYIGLLNYEFFITEPAFVEVVINTLVFLVSVVIISTLMGLFLALILENYFIGRSLARLLLISPFFIMPSVNALLWKHIMMHPIYGVLAQVWQFFGMEPVDWLTNYPLFSVIVIVSWQWFPFATLILMTSLQSMDREQIEASKLDGANYVQRVLHLYLGHLARPISVVIMIETIFLISVFIEIYITTGGGPGTASTNITFLIYKQALLNFDVGVASAGALFTIILANIIAIFLIRIIGKNLD